MTNSYRYKKLKSQNQKHTNKQTNQQKGPEKQLPMTDSYNTKYTEYREFTECYKRKKSHETEATSDGKVIRLM